MKMPNANRILTFDVEEWFHLLDFDDTRTSDKWEHFEVRIYENLERIFSILDETNTKATFFVLGWIAQKYPDIVKQIAAKYQIGSHTMNHQLVWRQTPEEFREDLDRSIKTLQDLTGQPVTCFRAPGFSIRESEVWAFDVMSELGITTDSSIFPSTHAHGGMPSFKQQCPGLIIHNGIELKEFPISYKTMLGHNVIFSGGGYFRLFPYRLIRRWTNDCGDYLLSYVHPRDLDGKQPMLKNLPITRRFKSYVGIKQSEDKLRKWLTEFSFKDIRSASDEIDWSSAYRVEI